MHHSSFNVTWCYKTANQCVAASCPSAPTHFLAPAFLPAALAPCCFLAGDFLGAAFFFSAGFLSAAAFFLGVAFFFCTPASLALVAFSDACTSHARHKLIHH